MIHYFTPYSTNKNIGEYYNSAMELLKNESDFACFTDGDSMFTVNNFGHQLNDIINKYPEQKIFTAVTNRVGRDEQCVSGMWDVEAMNEHWKKGLELQQNHYSDITPLTLPLSGVLILIEKHYWRKIGKFSETGMLGVDNDIYYKTEAIGDKVMIMKGVYMLHYYRGGTRQKPIHLL